MRIAMINPVLGEAFGQERVAQDSARLLRSRGAQVFFIGESLGGSTPDVDGYFLVENLASLSWRSNPALVAEVQAELLELLNETQIDLVHFIDQIDSRLIDAVTQRFPSVITSHTMATNCPSSTRATKSKTACTKKSGWGCLVHHYSQNCLSHFGDIARRADAILNYKRRVAALKNCQVNLAISKFVERSLLLDGWTNVELVYNPIHIPKNPAPIIRSKTPVMVVAARLVEHKGVGQLITALSYLKDKSWELQICGDGPLRSELERHVDQVGLRSKVQFLGRLSYTDTQERMALSQIVVQPNLGPEPFGLSVAEASALGRPVVGFDLPAINEIVIDCETGSLSPAGDTVTLAKDLNHLLENPDLCTSMGRAGRKRVTELFSEQAHLSKTELCYERARKEFAQVPAMGAELTPETGF